MTWQRIFERFTQRKLFTPPLDLTKCGWCDVPLEPQDRYIYTGNHGDKIALCDDCAWYLGFCRVCKRAKCVCKKAVAR